MKSPNLEENLRQRGISRREFLKFCTIMAGTLALERSVGGRIAHALQDPQRTPVVWLEFQDCAGCTESFLRASRPTAAEVVLDVLALNYHETIMAAAGHQAEQAKADTIDAGGYLLVVEGSIPTADNGVYCTIGGHTALDILEEAAQGANAIICVGNCACFGNIPAAEPNPTGAVGVRDLIDGPPILNLAGCPLNAVNLTAAIVHFLTFNELPAADHLGRPLFAHSQRIHDNCERRGHFDAGQFVKAWGDEGHRKGWCLYEMGCKGPVAFYNCPTVRWNDGTSWPIGSGHGCIACTEPDFWELGAYNTIEIYDPTPPVELPPVTREEQTVSPAAAGVAGGAIGIALGAAGMATARHLAKSDEESEADELEEE